LATDVAGLRHEVLRLALPAVGEQVIILMATIVDTFLVGHLGAASLAALGLSNQLVALSTVLFVSLGVGGGVLVAQAIGAGETVRAHRILGQALWLALAAGLGLMAVGVVLASPALRLMGAETEALYLGTPLLQLLAISLPFQAVLFVGSACLRGAGDTRTPMLIIAVATLLEVISAVSLVNGLNGLPRLGTHGVAAGALAGRVAGTLLLLGLMGHGRLKLVLGQIPWRPDLSTAESILRLGSPAGGEQLALRLGQIANIRVVAGLGTSIYAAYLVAFNSVSLAFLVGIGFTAAATTVVGQRVGASNPRSAYASAREAWHLAVASMGCMGVGFVFLAPLILGFFTNDPQVVMLATLPLQMVAIALPAEATNQVLGGALRGAGDTRWPMLVTTGGNWLVRLPLTLLLAGRLGLIGAWLAVIADIGLRALANIWRFRGGTWLPLATPQVKGAA
jgi:MATE family multidrug resistance protein